MFLSPRRTSPWARGSRAAVLSIHAAGPQPGGAQRVVAEDAREDEDAAESLLTSSSTCSPTRRSSRSPSTATRPRASASRRSSSTTRSTTPTASARSRNITPSSRLISWCWKSCPKCRASPISLDQIYIKSPLTGRCVPLSTLVNVDTKKSGCLSINHQGQFPAVTITFNTAPGVALGEAVEAIQAAMKRDRHAVDAASAASRATPRRSRPR